MKIFAKTFSSLPYTLSLQQVFFSSFSHLLADFTDCGSQTFQIKPKRQRVCTFRKRELDFTNSLAKWMIEANIATNCGAELGRFVDYIRPCCCHSFSQLNCEDRSQQRIQKIVKIKRYLLNIAAMFTCDPAMCLVSRPKFIKIFTNARSLITCKENPCRMLMADRNIHVRIGLNLLTIKMQNIAFKSHPKNYDYKLRETWILLRHKKANFHALAAFVTIAVPHID